MYRFFLFCIFGFLLSIISCQEVENLPQADEADLIEFLEKEELFILSKILKNYPNIMAAIKEQDAFTLFAPTDDAFHRAFNVTKSDNLEAFIKRIGGDEYLEIYIKHHVLSFAMDFGMVKAGQNTVPLSNVLLTVNRATGIPILRGFDAMEVTYVKKNLKINNSIVHIIDDFGWPLFGMGVSSEAMDLIPRLSNTLSFEFTAALVSIPNLLTELEHQTDISIFVPGNNSFFRLYAKFEVNNLEELIDKIGVEKFRHIILYHIVPEMVWFSTNRDHLFKSLNGQYFKISRNGDVIKLIDYYGLESLLSMQIYDAPYKNGILQYISEVLMPDMERL